MSQIKVDTITDELGTGSPSFPNGVDAADLTGNVDAALLTGTLPAIDGSALTGVGGATTQLVAPTAVSGVTSLTISLPSGYSEHIIKLQELKFDGTQLEQFRAQLGDASGIADTSSNYHYCSIINKSSSVTNVDDANNIKISNEIGGAGHGGGLHATIRVYQAADGGNSGLTYLSWDCFSRNNVSDNLAITGAGGTSNRQVNANIKFFASLGTAFSGSYEVWGVNP